MMMRFLHVCRQSGEVLGISTRTFHLIVPATPILETWSACGIMQNLATQKIVSAWCHLKQIQPSPHFLRTAETIVMLSCLLGTPSCRKACIDCHRPLQCTKFLAVSTRTRVQMNSSHAVLLGLAYSNGSSS